mmetsp:Transcript_2779/g.5781  ORF Transcript_2779/g.5781 Transcript_2779/m.5781 type:complete len:127 (+) Transcript_2779:223-603(+)|eukprot:CAMPEP_0194314332 /NCGR_PEP_ID=MMETSP0171-20130528/11184_1 /TAXON_ID=218684 /ORGANISM="Corethron pennatum, Strain L29A3" /LENGTH=126 /DNA_ID=CAMNT_0039069709 /DNA_START=180 /DNA_END=560 /DNA_ORIENTATION=-
MSSRRPIRRVGGGTFTLEAFKFGLYVAIPVLATAAYNTPGVMDNLTDLTKITGKSGRWAPQPSVGPMPSREEIKEIRRRAEMEEEEEYQREMAAVKAVVAKKVADPVPAVGGWRQRLVPGWFRREK